MIKELIKLANHLDKKGFIKEADYLDKIIKESDIMKDKMTNMNMHIARDLGIDTNTYLTMFPGGYEAEVGPKKRINLSKQLSRFSLYEGLISKGLKNSGLPMNNLKESWCIFPKVGDDPDASRVEIRADLNTVNIFDFSTCNYLYVTVPMWNSKYGTMLKERYSTSKQRG